MSNYPDNFKGTNMDAREDDDVLAYDLPSKRKILTNPATHEILDRAAARAASIIQNRIAAKSEI